MLVKGATGRTFDGVIRMTQISPSNTNTYPDEITYQFSWIDAILKDDAHLTPQLLKGHIDAISDMVLRYEKLYDSNNVGHAIKTWDNMDDLCPRQRVEFGCSFNDNSGRKTGFIDAEDKWWQQSPSLSHCVCLCRGWGDRIWSPVISKIYTVFDDRRKIQWNTFIRESPRFMTHWISITPGYHGTFK